MKIKHVFYCGLLLVFFGAGAIWSPIFLGAVKDGKDAFETVSYIATIIAAVAAVSALNSWKTQFRLERRYEDLQKLREALNGLSLISRLFKAYADYHVKSQIGGAEDVVDTRYKEAVDELFLEWSGAVTRYSYCWRVCSPFLKGYTDEKLHRISPEQVRIIFKRFKDDFRIAVAMGLDDWIGSSQHIREACEEIDKVFLDGDDFLSEIISEQH